MAEERPAFLFINRGLHNVLPIWFAALNAAFIVDVCVSSASAISLLALIIPVRI